MKRITSILVCLVVYGMSIFGQSVQITGTVTSADDGSALPGVTVVVKGDPSTGTITTIDGKYEISAPSDAILVFNYVGMETQEVQIAGQTNISIAMTGSIEMEEVVVTAYGINKDRKALGYSASDFKSEELEKVNIVSATQALQGKAAGVSIASASGAPGASTRVLIRGLSSITQSNQPLYVIDGIVINNQYNNANSTQASTSVNRTVDFGNAASDINPEDIASISILKGAAATNLYGSRAANGVVIITTKSGRQGDKMQVKFSTAFSLDEVGRLPYYQDRFGQGWSGHFDPVENGSWGPVMDGEDRLFGNTVDNSRRLMPFEFQENGIRDVFDYGTTYTNSLSLSGGTEKSTYYASYTNTKQDGIVPGDVDLLNRNSFLLKASSGTDKTKVDFSANYTHKKINAIATGQGDDAGGGKTLYQELLQNPVSHYVPLYRDYKNKFDNLDNYFTPYAQNPYYIINENGNEYKQDRLISSIKVAHDIIPGLTVSWQGSLDHFSSFYKDFGAVANITPGSPNSSANDVKGLTKEEAVTVNQINSDLFLKYGNKIDVGSGVLNYDVMIGNVINERNRKRVTIVSQDLVVPEYYNVQNLRGTPAVSTFDGKRRSVGFLGSINLDYNDYLFLQLSARQDHSSTLPTDDNAFFYPGASLGFVFSDLLGDNDILSFGKLRISYALAGNDGPWYAIDPYYNAAVIRGGGFGATNFPVNSVAAFEYNARLGNPSLKNELSKEFEIGGDFGFLNDRIGFDLSYYNKKVEDLIFDANIAASSGFWLQTTNLGTMTSSGVELELDLYPIRTADLEWEWTFIYNKATTILDELSAELGVSEYLINSAYQSELVAIPGEKLGQFRIPDYKRNSEGEIIVGSNGLPLEGDKRLVGSALPDYTMSFANRLSYKDLALTFLVNYQKGGYMYSYTSSITYWSGNNEQSLINDRRPWVIPNSVQEVKDNAGNVTGYVENSTPVHNNWHEYYSSNTNRPIAEERIIEKTHLRLREVTLTYTLPKKLVQKAKLSDINLSLYGRNLLLWTVADNSFVDPESTTWDNDIEGLFGEFGVAPQIRTYGVKLNLKF